MYFRRVLIFAVSVNCFKIILGERWKTEHKSLYYNVFPISNSTQLNETLISDEKTATSVMACSLFCMKRERISLYYRFSESKCYCNTDSDKRLDFEQRTEDVASEILYGYINSSVQVSTNNSMRKFDIQPYEERNCFQLYHQGHTENAIYVVKPIVGEGVEDVFCDMDNVVADDCLQWYQHGYFEDGEYKIRLSNGTTANVWCNQTGGGWTVIQRRQDGSVDFYRTWADYVNGFGNISGEYWLGLEAIYLLTKRPSSLRINMDTFGDVTPSSAYALYNEIVLQDASEKYRISIGPYTGNCADSLSYHNNSKFSTWDNDNDGVDHANCASLHKGAWWYDICYKSNLNGLYHGGKYTGQDDTGVVWSNCWGFQYSLKACSMQLKRN